MSGIVAFDDLFPVKPNPTALDRVFGFDVEDGKSRAYSIQSILDMIDAEPVAWGEITGKPATFTPEAHTFGSHSNVASGVDTAPDGTFVKKVGGQYTAVAVDFYGVSNPPPPDQSIDNAVRLIDGIKTAQWDQAFGWGNHAGQYRPISYVPSWAEITGKPPTFAPSGHTLASHSDAAALASAVQGQVIRKAEIGWDVFTPDYYSPFNPPPPDASIPAFVRDFTIGQFAGYEAKMLEFADLPDGTLPMIKDGVPADSQLKGVMSQNPFDPETQPTEYDAFVSELLYLISTKRIKGVEGVDADDYATLGQVPVLFEEDLEAIANAAPHGALNPFATMSDLFSRSVYDLLQDGATDGQAVVWSDANMRWEPGSVAGGGGGADANAVHYNAADGKNGTEKRQARTNIGSSDGDVQIVSTTGSLGTITRTANAVIFNGTAQVNLSGMTVGIDNEEVAIFNLTGVNMFVLSGGASPSTTGFLEQQLIPDGSIQLYRYSTISNRWIKVSLDRWFQNPNPSAGSNSPLWTLYPVVIGTPAAGATGQGLEVWAGTSDSFFRLRTSTGESVLDIFASNKRAIFQGIVRVNGSTDGYPLSVKSAGDSSGSAAALVRNLAGTAIFDLRGNGLLVLAGSPRIYINSPSGTNTSSFHYKGGSNNNATFIFAVDNSSDAIAFRVYGGGKVTHGRSVANTDSLIRDEQRIYYLISITSAGAITNQALTAGNFNYRFSAATSIAGLDSPELGKVVTLQNDNTVDLTLLHESATATATFRFKFIGSVDLVIPPGGKVDLIYCSGNRWELKSKNF